MEQYIFIALIVLLNPFVLGYFIGSIPFGLLLAKFAGHGDIREIGSGNIGATNVLRTGSKKLAALTLLLDAAKGAALIVAIYFYQYKFASQNGLEASTAQFAMMLAGLGAMLGHCFPIWLKFKGGKGVATAIGVLLAATPWTALIVCAAWLASAFAFRISSLAALIAIGIAPIATFLIYGTMAGITTLLISSLVFWRHKDNIKRLKAGEEPRIGKKKDKACSVETNT